MATYRMIRRAAPSTSAKAFPSYNEAAAFAKRHAEQGASRPFKKPDYTGAAPKWLVSFPLPEALEAGAQWQQVADMPRLSVKEARKMLEALEALDAMLKRQQDDARKAAPARRLALVA